MSCTKCKTLAVLLIVEPLGSLALAWTTRVKAALAPAASVAMLPLTVPVPPAGGLVNAKAGPQNLAARALVPDLLGSPNHGVHAPVTPRDLFPDAGLACVRTHDGSVRLLMDFGPLGFTSTAAHGHADALSVWLSIDDEYFLVDAGTYAYHSHPEWRAFFRSTAAHNTARVDGLNQSEIAGRFAGANNSHTGKTMHSKPQFHFFSPMLS